MLQPATVVIGFHSHGSVVSKFCYSLCRAVAYEGGKIKSVIEHTSPYTDDSRNKIVQTFLALPYVDYLLMVDADLEFEKDAISKTMWIAQHTGADVVWGNYALGNFTNSMFRKDPDSDLAISATAEEVQPDRVYEGIYAGGTGWCLMKRDLLEAMKDEYPAPWHWFDRDTVVGQNNEKVKLGEDLTFGKRVFHMKGRKQVGYTGLNLIHHKMHATVPIFMASEQKSDVHVMTPQGS